MLESKWHLWFTTLAEMGGDEAIHQNIPIEFKSDDWWRSLI
jgi:hypothetical protein